MHLSDQLRLMSARPSHPTLKDIVAYFEGKTRNIIRRYGPGPRVHYHAGLVDEPPPANAQPLFLRKRLVTGQEQLLWHAAEVWNASSTLRGNVLDVGCGLGGGAIFWAQEFGAQVTAVTCVASHVEWVARFAAEAGVARRVCPVVCDAATMPGENRFDAAVAIDSSGYLPRKEWFRRVASLLRPGGQAFIADCFLDRTDAAAAFDRYWRTHIGTIDEYVNESRSAGLLLTVLDDVSHRTINFWTTTLALIAAEAQNKRLEPAEALRLEASLRAHASVRDGFIDGSFRYALMRFSKA
jgi:SAM-dependent methyltransferase